MKIYSHMDPRAAAEDEDSVPSFEQTSVQMTVDAREANRLQAKFDLEVDQEIARTFQVDAVLWNITQVTGW